MQLYTICIHDSPVVTLSVGAEPPMEDSIVANHELLKIYREGQAINALIKARSPGVEEIDHQMEIDEALNTWLGADLRIMEMHGVPPWDGDRDKLKIRKAGINEAEKWHTSRRKALDTGEIDAGDEDWLVFLVPVRDPTDDE